MERNDFFKALCKDCITEEECLIRLLEARGFLFDVMEDKLIISDNSHEEDEKYLNSILKKYGLGHVEAGRIVFSNCSNYIELEKEFAENTRILEEVCWINYDWRWFKNRRHGYKAPVAVLEPFIARYVKAASACCVVTVGCCDGNHKDDDRMNLQLMKNASEVWHRVIWTEVLGNKYNIPWDQYYTSVNFKLDKKYDIYFELNKAAAYLYENRKWIRGIKEEALLGMSSNIIRHSSQEDIADIFKERVSEILKSKNSIKNFV